MTLATELPATLTHAGGVVHRTGDGISTVLLVRAKRSPHEWVLPKGHIERGETAVEAARREVREEASVDALPEHYLGDVTFRAPDGGRVHVAFYLMRFDRALPRQEPRDVKWCTVSEALQLTPFDTLRSILRSADRMLSPGGG
jgi:ADP-ribose pyrophosphatase YjhB (NUDIX family)